MQEAMPSKAWNAAREMGPDAPEIAILIAKVMSPMTDAMGFIDYKKRLLG